MKTSHGAKPGEYEEYCTWTIVNFAINTMLKITENVDKH